MIAFTVPGAAVGKGRPRVTSRGGFARLYTPDKTMNYEDRVRHAAHQAMAGRVLFDCPMAVNLTIACAVPASWSGKKQRSALCGDLLPASKPDIDNVVKAIFDALNGTLWRDDVQVVDCRATKRYAGTPGVRVEAWSVMEPLADPSAAQPSLLTAFNGEIEPLTGPSGEGSRAGYSTCSKPLVGAPQQSSADA